MKKTIYTIALFSLTFTAWASSLPTKFIMVNPLGKVQLYSSNDQGVVLANLQNVARSLSGGRFDLPTELPVIVPHNYGNAFFHPMAFMLISPFQININGATKHPNYSRTIEMHEFGHAIFDTNLEKLVSFDAETLKICRDYKRLRETIKNSSRLVTQSSIELEFLLPVIKAKNLSENHPISQDAIKNASINKTETAKLEEIAKRNQQVLKYTQALQSFLVPLNEFFADVVAVTMTQNPQAINRAITHTRNKLDFSDRSFDMRRSQRAMSTEVHNYYSLSREYIYKYYLSDPTIRSRGKTWIITKTFESITCVLKNTEATDRELKDQFRRQNSRVTWEMFEMEGKNEAFNKCIQAKFENRPFS